MSIANTNQVLLRNIDYLESKTPLFIDIECDGFFSAFNEHFPEASIHCHSTRFDLYQSYQKQNKISHASFAAAYTGNADVKHDLIVIAFPKSKREFTYTLSSLANYIEEEAEIIIVGEKKGGVASAPKLTNALLSMCNKIDAARHCMMFYGKFQPQLPSFDINEWFEQYRITLNDVSLVVSALPGVFSQQNLDKGTALLLENLPVKMAGKTLDFGCGAGVIASYIALKYPATQVELLDVSALALASAEKTMTNNGVLGRCFASNSLGNVKERYEHIVSNPPFHQGIKTHYQATEQFLHGAKKCLNKQGTMTIVANSFLKYPPILKQHFGDVDILDQAQGFSIYFCTNR
ncbi:methyltransferase [Thalassotalea agarivorans]|uniref:Ribosomal RNA small subunit methyltransferase C n=1 Tax=Thalassotalea agarivorans TaxID=349064 RepID=A0A1I0AUM1_THASX|nr:methyltransferase [Thalassotalea agarivorans]SES97882.1 16S rRNA m(2)G 1207 methyltransferase [Thalassotalea agarivorans]